MSENTIPQTGRQRENNEDAEQDKTPEGPLQTDHGTTTIDGKRRRQRSPAWLLARCPASTTWVTPCAARSAQ